MIGFPKWAFMIIFKENKKCDPFCEGVRWSLSSPFGHGLFPQSEIDSI